MEIRIVVEESRFKDVIENELKAFKSEEIHDIIKDAIKESLSKDDILKNFLVDTRYDSWSGGRAEYIPSKLLLEAAKNVDISSEIEGLAKKMIDELTKHHNRVLENLLLDMIIQGLTEQYKFRDSLEKIIRDLKYQGKI